MLQLGVLVIVVSAAIGLAAMLAPPWMKTGKRAPTQTDLRTGSVLIVAPDSSLCQERTIENDTWRIRNGSLVDCEDAFARNAGAPPSGSRLDLIREGFRHK
jgi:hypothetical protein